MRPSPTTPITTGQATVYDKLTPIAMFVQGDLVVAVQPNSAVNDLKGGQLDFVDGLNATLFNSLQGQPNIATHVGDGGC